MDLNELIYLGATTLISGARTEVPNAEDDTVEIDRAIFIANKIWLKVREAEDAGKLGV